MTFKLSSQLPLLVPEVSTSSSSSSSIATPADYSALAFELPCAWDSQNPHACYGLPLRSVYAPFYCDDAFLGVLFGL